MNQAEKWMLSAITWVGMDGECLKLLWSKNLRGLCLFTFFYVGTV